MVSYRHWSVLLWWDPNDVPHRRILPSYEAERWSVQASLCWWCCYCLADQLWVLIAYARRRRRLQHHLFFIEERIFITTFVICCLHFIVDSVDFTSLIYLFVNDSLTLCQQDYTKSFMWNFWKPWYKNWLDFGVNWIHDFYSCCLTLQSRLWVHAGLRV